MLTIYTKPGCHPCRLTIKTANKLGLNYQEKLRLPSFSGHPICTDLVSVGEDVHCAEVTLV